MPLAQAAALDFISYELQNVNTSIPNADLAAKIAGLQPCVNNILVSFCCAVQRDENVGHLSAANFALLFHKRKERSNLYEIAFCEIFNNHQNLNKSGLKLQKRLQSSKKKQEYTL